jgi:hypothetical protein
MGVKPLNFPPGHTWATVRVEHVISITDVVLALATVAIRRGEMPDKLTRAQVSLIVRDKLYDDGADWAQEDLWDELPEEQAGQVRAWAFAHVSRLWPEAAKGVMGWMTGAV